MKQNVHTDTLFVKPTHKHILFLHDFFVNFFEIFEVFAIVFINSTTYVCSSNTYHHRYTHKHNHTPTHWHKHLNIQIFCAFMNYSTNKMLNFYFFYIKLALFVFIYYFLSLSFSLFVYMYIYVCVFVWFLSIICKCVRLFDFKCSEKVRAKLSKLNFRSKIFTFYLNILQKGSRKKINLLTQLTI